MQKSTQIALSVYREKLVLWIAGDKAAIFCIERVRSHLAEYESVLTDSQILQLLELDRKTLVLASGQWPRTNRFVGALQEIAMLAKQFTSQYLEISIPIAVLQEKNAEIELIQNQHTFADSFMRDAEIE